MLVKVLYKESMEAIEKGNIKFSKMNLSQIINEFPSSEEAKFFYGRTSSDGKVLVGVGVPENGSCGVDCVFMVLSK